jgi:DNA polymerase-1
MGVDRFLLECYRSGMYDMTREEAADLRAAWFASFPEMRYYMSPTECPGLAGEEEEDDKHPYMASTLTGRIRRGCSFNSACNFPFQGLAADGAKIAMWALVKQGFRLVNFIHDEFLLEIALAELHQKVLQARRIMEEAMATVIPDVKIGTEATAMLRWCKGAEALYDAQGRLVPWAPENTQ